ncbi:hypothetical protein L228DRAFT_165399 [Xylona heveae TC161]|uniref:Copper-fist domain-containing protein n=1 Tax=Xylona heveae (strain CBS 132557 / TC161) TaxID=1328760 RepID=A0A165FJJ9_XYLHT|nr:hypothetical protein L228DRAFT_165399 [Xylona heveae TC161]KZF21050.1 hypothetical protein L228DRAFT_165399 [Xylona heveae TC161]
MLIDGEKWACEACVRGHRVSNCQHADRPLTHINKKGRPVSQCQHCRGLRKSRSAHVKCDCSEKPHTKGGHSCCCSHGSKCTCSMKKDARKSVSEILELSKANKEAQKPRLTTVQSESSLTVFANGHHKPAHKHNQMAHKSGMPYQIPRYHSVSGGMGDALPRSSMDKSFDLDAERSQSVMSASATPSIPEDTRVVKSEQTSPRQQANSASRLNSRLPPLDIDFPVYDTSNMSQEQLDLLSAPGSSYEQSISTPELDPPLLSAGVAIPPVDWSAFDLPLDTGAFSNNSFSQAPSFAGGFDYGNLSQAEVAPSSSGGLSDFGDFTFSNDSPLNPPGLVHNQVPSDSSELCESDSYRLSTASSYIGLPQTSMLASENLGTIDIDEFLKGTRRSPSDDISMGMHNDFAAATADLTTLFDDQPKSSFSRGVSPDDMLMMAPQMHSSATWPTMNTGASMPFDTESEVPECPWIS